jgi:hypothetical protein
LAATVCRCALDVRRGEVAVEHLLLRAWHCAQQRHLLGLVVCAKHSKARFDGGVNLSTQIHTNWKEGEVGKEGEEGEEGKEGEKSDGDAEDFNLAEAVLRLVKLQRPQPKDGISLEVETVALGGKSSGTSGLAITSVTIPPTSSRSCCSMACPVPG